MFDYILPAFHGFSTPIWNLYVCLPKTVHPSHTMQHEAMATFLDVRSVCESRGIVM